MKIKFDPNLAFQKQAIDAITGVFEGQEICRTNFTVAPLQFAFEPALPGMEEKGLGIGNRLKLLDEDILENIRNIQLKNGLAPSENLDSMDFTVEMETGTGKTYVYLRTIFELNRLYGFTKFIIVVPSIAIKEGVHKSLQITADHFRELYENVSFDYFVYDSGKLSDVRNFATSPDIQIMVINIDAFRKSFSDPEKENKANIIHRSHDRMTGAKPIEYIQETHPIVIIDEPQSVDTTARSKQAVASLNPLCKLRYSATHVDKYHMLYKLDSVDAYEQKLVKQIEVAGVDVVDGHNKAYIKLISVDNKKSPITAKIEMDCRTKTGGVQRKTVTVKSGDDLFEKSNGRDIYDGYIIDEIYCKKGSEYIDFTSRPEILNLGQAVNEVDPDETKRLQIAKTIDEHLEKEMQLRSRGIKVLSLFFIDKVANYRWYDEHGNPQKGKFAAMFEQAYARAIKKPRYQTLFDGVDLDTLPAEVHNGYFAADKKKDASGKEMLKDASGKTLADESAYNLIMKDGERVHGFDVNTLTVMANESYEAFAAQLQKEIEQEEGIKFGVVEKHLFANMVVSVDGHVNEYLGVDASKTLWDHLKTAGYIDAGGKVQEPLKKALKTGDLDLPEAFEPQARQIVAMLKKVAGKLNIKNRDNRKNVSLNKAVYLSEDFKQLWDRIKYRTTFRVDFDVAALAARCAEEIKANLHVGKARFIYRKARTEIDRGGVHAEQIQETAHVYDARSFELPDLITYLQNETNLTRRTIVKIINHSGRLASFKNNPQKFIEQVSTIIKNQMRLFVVDGIKYHRIGNDHYYAQQLFEENELFGYLHKNMVESRKSIFDHVVYDSDIELEFATAFEKSNDVKLYAKLPKWFRIDTPLGAYNPDWAVLIAADGREKLYFVVETKSTLFTDALRPMEKAKIACGKAHFKSLGSHVDFAVTNAFEDFTGKYVNHENFK
jgi:type III restriction enzyme